MPRISVIIPTYNRGDMVVRCVKSVLAADWDDLEVIVVDDCSPDDTRERIAAEFAAAKNIHYLRNERNSFQAVSRNRGAAVATGDYFFFLDDDNIVDAAIFKEMMAVFAAQAKAGLVAPMSIHQRPGQENLIWALGCDFNRWTSQPKNRCENLPLAQLPAEPTVYPTTYSPNAFMVTRGAFAAVGGFDEKYIQIFEESDFGWMLMEKGYEGYLTTKARTNHYGYLEPGCVAPLRRLGIEKPTRTYCFAKNRLRFARKHFSVFQILSVALIFAPLSAVYYGFVALRNKRPDIAWAYLRGTFCGVFGCS